ncbi:MAG: acetamidase/formamidase family protein [Chloroflexota bacterium]|nr:acetamidase/formamidase family protein [Chloroflexota bacterium]
MTPTARTIHHIAREQRHLAWDNSIEPVLRIASGETVTIDAVEASGGQLGPDSTIDDMARLDFAACDPVQGPIYVQDAQPGDTLQIEMLDLETADWGWTAIIPGFGLLADEFAEPALKIWKLQAGFAEFVPGIRLPLEPFCGEIGVAPAETGAFSTIPPGPNGGNIDTKHLTKGATIYLPVLAPGALFSIGDGHAAQGDGEVCGTAIETPMRITLRLTVRKDLHVPELQYCTAGPLTPRTNIAPYYATTGHGPDLMEAARHAVRNMIDYLEHTYGLSRADAYMLCSVAADLKINEIVDAPNWIVGAYMPTSIFTGMGRS